MGPRRAPRPNLWCPWSCPQVFLCDLSPLSLQLGGQPAVRRGGQSHRFGHQGEPGTHVPPVSFPLGLAGFEAHEHGQGHCSWPSAPPGCDSATPGPPSMAGVL